MLSELKSHRRSVQSLLPQLDSSCAGSWLSLDCIEHVPGNQHLHPGADTLLHRRPNIAACANGVCLLQVRSLPLRWSCHVNSKIGDKEGVKAYRYPQGKC